MNKRIKQNYVLALHPESESVCIFTQENWDDEKQTFNIQCDEIDRFDDIDFANFEGQKYAEENNYDFEEYSPLPEKEIQEITFVDENLLELISDNIDAKDRVALEFDLKFCGNAFVDKNKHRIDPIIVRKTEISKGFYQYDLK